jgi:hypothetical protein
MRFSAVSITTASPQGDVELMTKKEILGSKRAPRLERVRPDPPENKEWT